MIDSVLADPLLAQFSAFLSARTGLHFPMQRWNELEQALGRAAVELGCADARSCMQALPSRPVSRAQVEILARHLTVGETYFFRDRASFEALEQRVLPQLIDARRQTERRLRIWSAGCSTGDEPYSIAMLLARMIPDLHDWNICILATDINPQALQRAARGVFNEWSFRDVLPEIKERFFKRTRKGHFELDERIRRLVTFSYLNLADEAYPSISTNTNAMDVIFCRNVLMYFELAHSRALIERLSACLLEGGWLFVSPVETPHVIVPQLVMVNFPGAIVYRKDTAPRRALATDPFPRTMDWTAPTRERDDATRSSPALEPRRTEVREALPKTVAEQPTDADAMAALARTHANEGRLVEAREWCEKAIAVDKLNPRWCYLLATILQEQGRLTDAIAALERALYLDPSYPLAHFALGNLTRQQGRPKASQRHFRNALSTLSAYPEQDALPEADGITAGALAEIIKSTLAVEKSA